MNSGYRDQLDRIDRLMTVVEADDPHAWVKGLDDLDLVVFACQSMWHLKDWILNDAKFGAADREALKRDIHQSIPLLICRDLANRSKHLTLDDPKTDATLSDLAGFHYEPSKGICRGKYYVVCHSQSEEYHGIEARDLLRRCRDEWQRIINRHYLSRVDADWAAFVDALPTSGG